MVHTYTQRTIALILSLACMNTSIQGASLLRRTLQEIRTSTANIFRKLQTQTSIIEFTMADLDDLDRVYQENEHLSKNNSQIVNCHSKLRNTLLHFAAGIRCTKKIALLLKHNADVNAENNDGMTPLALSFVMTRTATPDLLQTIKLLIAHGAHLECQVHDDLKLRDALCNNDTNDEDNNDPCLKKILIQDGTTRAVQDGTEERQAQVRPVVQSNTSLIAPLVDLVCQYESSLPEPAAQALAEHNATVETHAQHHYTQRRLKKSLQNWATLAKQRQQQRAVPAAAAAVP